MSHFSGPDAECSYGALTVKTTARPNRKRCSIPFGKVTLVVTCSDTDCAGSHNKSVLVSEIYSLKPTFHHIWETVARNDQYGSERSSIEAMRVSRVSRIAVKHAVPDFFSETKARPDSEPCLHLHDDNASFNIFTPQPTPGPIPQPPSVQKYHSTDMSNNFKSTAAMPKNSHPHALADQSQAFRPAPASMQTPEVRRAKPRFFSPLLHGIIISLLINLLVDLTGCV
ncbi:uncharacterized protein MEPE_02953 [Melanopsichium pennsylvanicum]|uniref:Uncharacterized protein n=1 Tax=Melanopsichium pennsylvanicum TaxID=63383 RepID=A0AAJ4XKL0_9BASI|nr:uncharacterized protein MEPE_02953 [Melanopsichium pennsylvanicum]